MHLSAMNQYSTCMAFYRSTNHQQIILWSFTLIPDGKFSHYPIACRLIFMLTTYALLHSKKGEDQYASQNYFGYTTQFNSTSIVSLHAEQQHHYHQRWNVLQGQHNPLHPGKNERNQTWWQSSWLSPIPKQLHLPEVAAPWTILLKHLCT